MLCRQQQQQYPQSTQLPFIAQQQQSYPQHNQHATSHPHHSTHHVHHTHHHRHSRQSHGHHSHHSSSGTHHSMGSVSHTPYSLTPSPSSLQTPFYQVQQSQQHTKPGSAGIGSEPGGGRISGNGQGGLLQPPAMPSPPTLLQRMLQGGSPQAYAGQAKAESKAA